MLRTLSVKRKYSGSTPFSNSMLGSLSIKLIGACLRLMDGEVPSPDTKISYSVRLIRTPSFTGGNVGLSPSPNTKIMSESHDRKRDLLS